MGTLLSISLLSSLVLALCYITYKCFLASDKVCSLQSICFAVGISGGICHTCLVDHEAFRTFSESIDKKAVGVRFPSLANSLNHSQLKKRVNMMYKKSYINGKKSTKEEMDVLLPSKIKNIKVDKENNKIDILLSEADEDVDKENVYDAVE